MNAGGIEAISRRLSEERATTPRFGRREKPDPERVEERRGVLCGQTIHDGSMTLAPFQGANFLAANRGCSLADSLDPRLMAPMPPASLMTQRSGRASVSVRVAGRRRGRGRKLDLFATSFKIQGFLRISEKGISFGCWRHPSQKPGLSEERATTPGIVVARHPRE